MVVRNRWMILTVSVVAQVASVSAMFGVPVVLPQLREAYGVTTAQAGILAGLPSFGVMLTLLVWGVVIDRVGERSTMVLSLVLTAGTLGLLWTTTELWAVAGVLLMVGAVGGPVNAASGRLVLTWFGPDERGLAMGIRQSALPLGVGLAALVLPWAADAWGFVAAMTLPAVLSLLAVPLVLAMASEPPRLESAEGKPERVSDTDPDTAPDTDRDTESGTKETEAGSEPAHRADAASTGSPYGRWTIWRVHGASMLLGVPQVTLMVYAVIYLVQEQGWSAPAAGAVVAAAQIPGAAGRLLLGARSDRTGDRMRPVRWLAVVSGVALVLLTFLPNTLGWTAVPLVLACLVLTMWHNGLTFLAVAEIAGTSWAGRALAVQNWLQAISTTLTPVLMAAVITLAGLPAVFAVSAVFSALAIAVVPTGRRKGRGSITDQ